MKLPLIFKTYCLFNGVVITARCDSCWKVVGGNLKSAAVKSIELANPDASCNDVPTGSMTS